MNILMLSGLDLVPEHIYRLNNDLEYEGHKVNIVLWSELSRRRSKKKYYSYLDYFAGCIRDIIWEHEYDYVITYSISSNIIIRVINDIDEYLNIIMIAPTYGPTVYAKYRILLSLIMFTKYTVRYFWTLISTDWKLLQVMRPKVATCLFLEAANDKLFQSFSTQHVYMIYGRDDLVVTRRSRQLLKENIITAKEIIIDGSHDLLETSYNDVLDAVIYILNNTWNEI